MRPHKRLMRVALALAARVPAGQFHSIELAAVGQCRAGGRPPGLYRVGTAGSTAGLLVYDPAHGEPVVPDGRLTPWGLVIECHVAPEEDGAAHADEPNAGGFGPRAGAKTLTERGTYLTEPGRPGGAIGREDRA